MTLLLMMRKIFSIKKYGKHKQAAVLTSAAAIFVKE
jgi:hypothetical protein